MMKGWGPELAMNKNGKKNQWKRVDGKKTKDGMTHEIMLTTDLCMAYQYSPNYHTCMQEFGKGWTGRKAICRDRTKKLAMPLLPSLLKNEKAGYT